MGRILLLAISRQKDIKKNKCFNKRYKEIHFHGIGKPEALRGNLSGYWSRRIDDVNRVVYTIDEFSIKIISCKGHYN